jgi:hypothetical protein
MHVAIVDDVPTAGRTVIVEIFILAFWVKKLIEVIAGRRHIIPLIQKCVLFFALWSHCPISAMRLVVRPLRGRNAPLGFFTD